MNRYARHIITPLPPQSRPVKWVHKVKQDSNGDIQRYKAQLVAKGFRQREGIDFHEVFAPVSKYATLGVLLAAVTVNNMELHQLDMTTALLNGVLKEEVYVEQPAGYEECEDGRYQCQGLGSVSSFKSCPSVTVQVQVAVLHQLDNH